MVYTEEHFSNFFSYLVDLLWGLPTIIFINACALIFTIYLKFPQVRCFKGAIKNLFTDGPNKKENKISSFQALSASISASVGLGNIAGCAIAISLAGPGTIFWMWVASFFGMASKLTSTSLAVLYRRSQDGVVEGGPMYTIINGLGKKFSSLAYLYSSFIALSAIGVSMLQSNQFAVILESKVQISPLVSAILLVVPTCCILWGGINRLVKITEKLAPIMILIYILACFGVIFFYADKLPEVFGLIFSGAFQGDALAGGAVGVGFREVLIQGIKRAIYANGAGMGDGTLVHAAANASPRDQGLVSMLSPLIDTVLMCTMTGLVIILTDAWLLKTGIQGVNLTAFAFESFYGPFGSWIIFVCIILFSFSTIIAYGYYGERGFVFCSQQKGVHFYRLFFLGFVGLAPFLRLEMVVNITDSLYALLAFPNLIANLLLVNKLRPIFGEMNWSFYPKILTPKSSQ